MSSTTRLARAVLGVAAGVLFLSACSASGTPAADPTTAGPTAPANEADIAFAREMIPHHEGALEMSSIAVARATDPRVRDLAERIEAGQEPEIDLLTGWLDDWGADPADDGMDAMDHGENEMDDGMSDTVLTELGGAEGSAFDLMWLRAMTLHHEGAVEMAEREIAEGRYDEAITLARGIAETQTAEIAEMRELIEELDG